MQPVQLGSYPMHLGGANKPNVKLQARDVEVGDSMIGNPRKDRVTVGGKVFDWLVGNASCSSMSTARLVFLPLSYLDFSVCLTPGACSILILDGQTKLLMFCEMQSFANNTVQIR